MENEKNYAIRCITLPDMKDLGQGPYMTLELARAWFRDLNKRHPTLVHYIVKRPTESDPVNCKD